MKRIGMNEEDPSDNGREELELTFDHDKERMTFEAISGDRSAVLEYRSNREGKMFLNNIDIPPDLETRGVESVLISHVLDYARANNYRIIPVCSGVKTYLREHPESQDIMASGIRLT